MNAAFFSFSDDPLNFSVIISCGADLVNVLCSSPSETAGVVAAENIEGRIIWVGPRGANHFHEYRICILLLCNARVTHCVLKTFEEQERKYEN